jgi:hypothetical protein
MKNLQGLNLTVLDIHRKGIFDMNAMVFCCDNCGRTIVNSATVKDEASNVYVIGLDCKKTLIDKKYIDKINIEYPEWEAKHKVKEFKRDCNDMQKVMMYLDNSEKYEVVVDRAAPAFQYLTVYDNTKPDVFGNMGATVFSESIGYLFRIGLKNILEAAQNKNIIKFK